jgi:leader peptidase (prepilin peptidase)/N-methyltransferase
MTAFVVVVCAVLGLAIGSFLNVVIYRVPAGKSVVSPPSSCPGCGSLIAPRDNIPVVSWLLLRGRCRNCGQPISARYPAIEALTAVLFALIGARFGASWSLPGELIFAAALVALAAIDLERFLLPRAIVYPAGGLTLVALVIAAAAHGQWHRFGVAAACAAASFAVFFAINFIRPAWMGFGDVRLSALIGLALGWLGAWVVVVGFMAANLLGAVTGVFLIARGRAGRRTALPYGVFLAAGSVFAVLAGEPIVHWYSNHLVR